MILAVVLGMLWEGGDSNALYYDDDGDDAGQGGNSTCAQWTKCAPCLDYFGGDEDEGCLWCNVPKDGGVAGLCVLRSKAQDSCEIGELLVRSRIEKYGRVCLQQAYLQSSPPSVLNQSTLGRAAMWIWSLR